MRTTKCVRRTRPTAPRAYFNFETVHARCRSRRRQTNGAPPLHRQPIPANNAGEQAHNQELRQREILVEVNHEAARRDPRSSRHCCCHRKIQNRANERHEEHGEAKPGGGAAQRDPGACHGCDPAAAGAKHEDEQRIHEARAGVRAAMGTSRARRGAEGGRSDGRVIEDAARDEHCGGTRVGNGENEVHPGPAGVPGRGPGVKRGRAAGVDGGQHGQERDEQPRGRRAEAAPQDGAKTRLR